MEKKGKIYEMIQDMEKIDEELLSYDIDDLKDSFKENYRDGQRLIRANKSSMALMFVDIKTFDVDNYMEAKGDIKLLEREAEDLRAEYKELFNEEI